MGFNGFRYFKGYNTAFLSYFAFFAFFSYFWIGKIAAEMFDERYLKNSRKAKAFSFNLAAFELIIICLLTPVTAISREILTVVSALCYASVFIAYAIAFYSYEKG